MPTRATIDRALDIRLGVLLDAAAIPHAPDPETGRVALYDDAISEALYFCGVIPADPSTPTDADTARLRSEDWWKLLDIAELRVLETIANRQAGAGGGTSGVITSQQWEDYKVTFSASGSSASPLELKRAQVRAKWGYGAVDATLRTGTIKVSRTPARAPEF